MMTRIVILEKRMWRMEKMMWYLTGIISIKFGGEMLPMVAAMIK